MQILKYVAILLCITTINACGKGLTMLNQSAIAKETERLKQTSRTVCVGRFLVNIPKQVEILGRDYHYVNEFWITPATEEQVQEAIREREKKLSSVDPLDAMPEHLVRKVSAAKPQSVIIARRLIDTDLGGGYQAGYKLEGFFGMSGNQYLLKSNPSAGNLDPALDTMKSVIALAQPRSDDEIPTDAGFCMDGLFFPDVEPEIEHYEKASLYLTLNGHPDVRIEIEFNMNGDKLYESLLTRLHNYVIEPEFLAFAAMTIQFREGNHPVGDILGEERLQSRIAGETFYNHSFVWESTGKANDYFSPYIHIRLISGKSPGGSLIRPSISDAQAIALFDFIVNSVRLRPFGPNAKNATPVPATPLGTLCRTGEACPETGWWEAVPPKGGIRPDPVLLTQGAIMPVKEILYVRRYEWMDDLFGLRKQVVPVQWELLAYPKSE